MPHTSARHVDLQARRRRLLTASAMGVALGVGLSVVGVQLVNRSRSDAGAGDGGDRAGCTTITVATARSFQPVLERLAKPLAHTSPCVQIEAFAADGNEAYDLAEERGADVWIADDAAWGAAAAAEYAATDEADAADEAESEPLTLASTPMLIAAAPETAAALQDSGWAGLAGAVGPGGLRVITGRPNRDGEDLLGLGALGDSVWDTKGMDASAWLLHRARQHSRTIADPATVELAPGEVALVSERKLLDAGAGAVPGAEVLTPTDATTLARFTMYDETGGSADEATQAAVQALGKALTTSDDLDPALAAAHLRRADGSLPAGAETADWLQADLAPARPVLEAHRLEHVLTTWIRADRVADVLLVIDVSGSMLAPAPGGSQPLIELVRRQVLNTADELPPSASLAVWVFGAGLDGDKDYREILPLGRMTPRHRADLVTAAASIQALNTGTGLHDTMLAAYRFAQDQMRDGVPRQVLVFTDGRNQDDPGSLTAVQLKRELSAAADPQRPVGLAVVKVGRLSDDLSDAVGSVGGYVSVARSGGDVVAAFIHFVAGGAH